jgi:ribosome-binding factor A
MPGFSFISSSPRFGPGLAEARRQGKARLALRPHRAYIDGMASSRFQNDSGPSQRQLRVGELIRRTMADVLNRGEIHDPDLNRMSITVSEVRCSPDLRIATAYVMPLGGKGVKEAITLLAKHKGELRHLVSKALTLKYTPDLRFQPDATFDQMDATRRLFADENVQRDLKDDAEED